MKFNCHNNSTMHTQAKSMRMQTICLRTGAYVPGSTPLLSIERVSIEILKDFVDHGQGGSDG